MGYKAAEQGHASLYDRVKKLLVSFEWSDCSFAVSGQKFKAHKLILGISSPVFEAMFYGPLSSCADIEITDIAPSIFQLLLNYIYTDIVEITSVETAFELLYASKKYLLDDLTSKCIDYIIKNISIDNVITVLNYPEFMQEEQMIAFALKLFCQHAHYLLEAHKSVMSPSCLSAILKSDQINISEKDLIKQVFKWTKLYCEQCDIPVNHDNCREILISNELLQSLRFSSLTLFELSEIVQDENNLLIPEEYDHIKKNLKTNGNCPYVNDTIDTVSAPRKCLKLNTMICHRSAIRSVPPLVIDTSNYEACTRIKATKSIFLYSLCIPTRMSPVLSFRSNAGRVYSEQITVVISSQDDTIIKSTNFMNTVEYDSSADIELSQPCLLQKDEWYKVSFKWPQNSCHPYSYVVQLRHNYYKDPKVTFHFVDGNVCAPDNASFLKSLKFCL